MRYVESMINDPIFADLMAPEEKKSSSKRNQNGSNTNTNTSTSSSDNTGDLDYLLPGIDKGTSNNDASIGNNVGFERRSNEVIGNLTKEKPGYWDIVTTKYEEVISVMKPALDYVEKELVSSLNKLNYKTDPYNTTEINNMIFLLLEKDKYIDYNLMALGYNVNETAYLNNKGQVILTFAPDSQVNYKGGPDGRRKTVSQTFRPVVNDMKKVVKKIG